MNFYKSIVKQIYKEYANKYHIISCDVDQSTCFLTTKMIFINNKIDKKEPAPADIFTLLHEIGHLETNDIDMCISLGEYLATEWAINKMKEYNFDIPKYEKKEWQDYIYNMRKNDVKDKYINIPKKKELDLCW